MNEPKSIEEAIDLLEYEVGAYKAMLSSDGWKRYEAELELYVADKQTYLESCSLEEVRKTQGQIDAIKWMRGHFDRVAEKLDELLEDKRSRDDKTEANG